MIVCGICRSVDKKQISKWKNWPKKPRKCCTKIGLAHLHNSGSECSPQFVLVETHQLRRFGQRSLGSVLDSAAATVVIRIVLERDVAQVKDRRDGGEHVVELALRHAQVLQVIAHRPEVSHVVDQGVSQRALAQVRL